MMGPPNADNNGTPSGVAARRGTRGNPRLTLGIDDEERSILDASNKARVQGSRTTCCTGFIQRQDSP